MPDQRLATALAAAAGGVLGAVLALRGPALERGDTEPTSEPPFRPVSQLASSARGGAAQAAAGAGGARSPARSAGPNATAPRTRRAPPEPAEVALAPPKELIRRNEQSCARGLPNQCLRAARFYEEGQGVKRDGQRALAYLRRAVQLYAEDCRARKARACYSLSRLYERGRGVPPDPKAAEALVQRVRDICDAEQSAFCDAPDAPDELRRQGRTLHEPGHPVR